MMSGRKVLTEFIVIVADDWQGRFPDVLEALRQAGAEVTAAYEDTGIIEGVVESCRLESMSQLACVNRVWKVLTYVSESPVAT